MYSANPIAGNQVKITSKAVYSAKLKDGIPVKINQTSKDKMGTVKLINCSKSNQKKLKIDITNTKGEKSMKIPSNIIKIKQVFLDTFRNISNHLPMRDVCNKNSSQLDNKSKP